MKFHKMWLQLAISGHCICVMTVTWICSVLWIHLGSNTHVTMISKHSMGAGEKTYNMVCSVLTPLDTAEHLYALKKKRGNKLKVV